MALQFTYSDNTNTVITGISGGQGATGQFPTIPDGVTSIVQSAFNGCSGLTGNIVIPASVTSIGGYAFNGCSGLTGNITIPSSVTSIGGGAFYGCSGLTGSVIIPSSLTTVEFGVFHGCSGLTGLTLPASVTSIGQSAFYGCSGLRGSLVFPLSMTSIGDYAFIACSGLTSITYYSTTTIGTDAFYQGPTAIPIYTDRTFIYSDNTNTRLTGVIAGRSATGALTIPNTVTSIGDYVFQGCSRLTGSLVIPNTVTSIGGYAFGDCTGLNGTLTLPSSLTSIGVNAFAGCSQLRGALTISITMTSIGDNAFNGCSGLTSITYYSTTSVNPSSFTGVRKVNVIYTDRIFIYTSSSNKYIKGIVGGTNATGALTIPLNIISITANAFKGCTKLTSITYYSTTSVDPSSFTGVPSVITIYTDGKLLYSDNSKTRLTGIIGGTNATGQFPTIPSSVTSIGEGAFSTCYELTGGLTLPNSVRTIGSNAFLGCSKLTGLTLPLTLTTISGNAFYGCYGLTGNIVIPISVTIIDSGAFYGCSGLTSITYYSTTTIRTDAFSRVPRVIRLYTDGTFLYSAANKTALTGIVGGTNATGALTIPITVTSVAANALAGCTKLTSISYYSTTTIGTNAFSRVPRTIILYTDRKFLYSSSSKTTITGVLATTGAFPAIPTTVVTGILDNAFKNSKLTSTSLTIPKNVKTVGKSAFAGCTGIKAITYYLSTTVDASSFTGIAKVNALRAMFDLKRFAMRLPLLKSD